MRGKQVGSELEKVRAFACARSGLALAANEIPSGKESEILHTTYLSSSTDFVKDSVREISKLNLDILVEENPADAIKLCTVAGLLVDRLTNRALIENEGSKRSREGIVIEGKEGYDTNVIPYTGRRNECQHSTE